jgi:stress response protein SCP2
VNLSKIKDDSSFFDIDLNKVSDKTSSVWFVINTYKKSFGDVKSAKLNIMGKKGEDFSSFDLNFEEEMS